MIPRTPTSTLFPYTTLFRSDELLTGSAVAAGPAAAGPAADAPAPVDAAAPASIASADRKSTRLNSSHVENFLGVLVLEKKKNEYNNTTVNLVRAEVIYLRFK